MYDFTIVGGGIVGLSTGMALSRRHPYARILVLEKENRWAAHQSGHNSGVIHSGVYYKPGSLKAQFATAGKRAVVEFCEEHGIKYDICGKVIVATQPDQVPIMEKIYQRGLANGLKVSKIGPEELKEIEPHVKGVAAIRVPSAGIVDYKQVTEAYAKVLKGNGATLRLNTRVKAVSPNGPGLMVESNNGVFQTRFLVNCAGLHSDRIARKMGVETNMKIVPFRGEYYQLKPEKRYLAKHLIYPVPNPDFPFLGVHFTRMINGEVHAGPNAVLSLKREGYTKKEFNLRDFVDVITYGGFWKLARKNWQEGTKEMIRSFSKAAFVRSLQELIPEVEANDIEPAGAGVRAQALMPNGKMMDDFVLLEGHRSIHVCNAPSPAATASIPIGEAIAERIDAYQKR